MKSTALWMTGLALCAVLVAGLGVCRADDEPVPIVISPSIINLDSQGVWVTVHAEIPYYVVDGFAVTLDGVPVDVTKADARGEFVAKFGVDDVKAILEPGTVTLTLEGATYGGATFSGSDTIKVIRVSGKR